MTLISSYSLFSSRDVACVPMTRWTMQNPSHRKTFAFSASRFPSPLETLFRVPQEQLVLADTHITRHVASHVLVGEEEYRCSLREDVIEDLLHICRRADEAVVSRAKRLQVRIGVDVDDRNDLPPQTGQLSPGLLDVADIGHIGKGASRIRLGMKDLLFGPAEHAGGFSHEETEQKTMTGRPFLGCLLGKLQGIARQNRQIGRCRLLIEMSEKEQVLPSFPFASSRSSEGPRSFRSSGPRHVIIITFTDQEAQIGGLEGMGDGADRDEIDACPAIPGPVDGHVARYFELRPPVYEADRLATSSSFQLSSIILSTPSPEPSCNSSMFLTSTSMATLLAFLVFSHCLVNGAGDRYVVLLDECHLERSKRWFRPPPMRTAYFSIDLMPGVVFLVSRICPPFLPPPDKRLVTVAMPESLWKMFRATRSPVRMALVRALILDTVAPFGRRSVRHDLS